MRLDLVDQSALELRAVGKRLPRYDRRPDTQFPRDLEAARTRVIRDNHGDGCVDAPVEAGLCHGFHVGAAAGDENREPQHEARPDEDEGPLRSETVITRG